ncbi:MAG TPA: hypothetical protein ENK50_12205 [Sedimenticola sp.]|nr:hypothetical protein [Sedimenticola sp.]
MQWRRHLTLWMLIALLGTGSLVTGCGQKGDLYRPGQEPQHKKNIP